MTTPLLPYTQLRTPSPSGLARWLLTGKHNRWWYLDRRAPPEDVWAEHRDVVVAHYARRHPGHRPRLWWKYSAPSPRARLGGIGDPLFACGGAYVEQYEFGVPTDWRVRDDHFERGVPLSTDDPPLFESSATYLLRLKLLQPGEAKRLRRRDFWPEVVRVSDGYVRLCRVNPT